MSTPHSQTRVSSGTPGTVVPTLNASIGNFPPVEEGEVSKDKNPYHFGTSTSKLSTSAKRPAADPPLPKGISAAAQSTSCPTPWTQLSGLNSRLHSHNGKGFSESKPAICGFPKLIATACSQSISFSGEVCSESIAATCPE
ncbi:hypothetical protein PGTUg99_033209 [Puccinia graminis f. sp. tritici]|uniref:Uncharacterized protein n=1 Tax=Puccinia graminis f. sp. tritici TaxID=56615 RepID=A0A5B0SK66_PUCGR|nr:hypothetical protein PGTUg99_033209 [Puccinia graminis f. sp. tritici]